MKRTNTQGTLTVLLSKAQGTRKSETSKGAEARCVFQESEGTPSTHGEVRADRQPR